MQKITVVCMGKLKEAYWRDAVAEYAKRLSAYCKLTIEVLDEERLPEHPSEAQIAAALDKEGKRMLAHIPDGAAVLPLCIEGKPISSVALSDLLAQYAVDGHSEVVFVIGSSYGLSDTVKRRGTCAISMSAMTFPHQLARVMLCEQIYRAMKIQEGGAYHK